MTSQKPKKPILQINKPEFDGFDYHFDIDGLYGASLFDEKDFVLPKLEDIDSNKIEGLEELTKIYYFEMRNSLALLKDKGRDVNLEAADKSREFLFESIARVARKHAVLELNSGKPLQPTWLEFFQYQFNNLIPGEIKEALSSVKFKVIHDGYMTTRVDNDNLIIVSSKLRAFLMAFNLKLLMFEEQMSTVMEIAKEFEPDKHRRFSLALQVLVFKPLFPYFLQPEFGLDLMRLPVIMANSGWAFSMAVEITGAQIEFILMHELGHVFCRHNQSSEPRMALYNSQLENLFRSSNFDLYQEYEADAFASSCLQYWPQEKIDFIYIGIEWVICFMQCMEMTGNKSRELLRPEHSLKNSNFSLRRDNLAKMPVAFKWSSQESRSRAIAATIIHNEFKEYLRAITKDDILKTLQHRRKPKPADGLNDLRNLYALYYTANNMDFNIKPNPSKKGKRKVSK